MFLSGAELEGVAPAIAQSNSCQFRLGQFIVEASTRDEGATS